MRYLLFIFFFAPSLLFSQSVSVSPNSVKFIGGVPSIGEVSVSYKKVSIHYFHVWELSHCCEVNGKFEFQGYAQSTPAISFEAFSFRDIVKLGPMLSLNKFPIEKGTRLNFYFDIGYSYNRFRLSYRHMSSGFGLIHSPNPGLDVIRISFQLFD